MIEARGAAHSVVYGDPFSYCAHPHLALAQDGSWVSVFNRAPRRALSMHPPEDPLYQNVVTRSQDEGRTWSAPEPVPGYNWAGTECAGLTQLADGRLMLNQWRFDWLPLGSARRRADQTGLDYPARFLAPWAASAEHDAGAVPPDQFETIAPWVRAGGATYAHFSDDCGISFGQQVRIETAPFSGGYGMRGAAQLPGGRILLPLSDVPAYRQVFVVDSRDGGRSWSPPRIVAAGPGHEFEEPALLRCRSGKLLMILRDNGTRHLHSIVSDDDGETWSAPSRLNIAGYPAHLLQLSDGRILMTYGWRQPDFGIRAVVSADEGKSWDLERTVHVRRGMANKNLGYPATLQRRDGSLFTIFYGEDPEGVTVIMGTTWAFP